MKKTRRILAVLLALAMVMSFAACGATSENGTTASGTADTTTELNTAERETKMNIAALNGPTGIGMAKLKTDDSFAYDVEYFSNPQDVVPLIVSGEKDLACLPLNLAANLYKKTNGNIEILAINTLGILHVLENGNTINSVADLKGKTIWSSGEGATPQYTIDYLLEQNGIDPEKDVDIQYASNHEELAAMAIEGKADIVILPEPFASKVLATNTDYREALDVTAEWDKISDTKLAFGCIVARKDYVEANPDLISEFMGFYEDSVNFVNNDTASAATLLVSEGFFDNEAIAEATIPGCNVVYITGEEMKAMANDNFEVLFAADPTSVGGEVPDEGIYYMG